MEKLINGKLLESHGNGDIIYYDNVLIQSKNQKLNEHVGFEVWEVLINNTPDFCPARYHKNIRCSKPVCDCGK